LKNRFIPQIPLHHVKREGTILKKTLTYLLVVFTIFSLIIPFTPIAHAQASSIKVLNYTHYFDSLGYIVVVGEVQNQGPNNINGTVLTGIITSSDGQQVNGWTQVWGKYLTPQQKAPFYMEFQTQTESGTYITDVSTVDIQVAQATPTDYYQNPNLLTIASSQGYVGTNPGRPATANLPSDGDLGVFWVEGTIRNLGSEPAQYVRVYGTFFNANGDPVAAGYSETNSTLAAGVISNFKLGAFDLNQSIVPADKKIATYSLLIQTEGPFSKGNAPVPVVTPTPMPISSATPAPSDGTEVNNDSATPMWVYGAVIAVGLIAVGAALLFTRRRNKPKPSVNLSQGKLKPKRPRQHR
jgi:hypothetical protein